MILDRYTELNSFAEVVKFANFTGVNLVDSCLDGPLTSVYTTQEALYKSAALLSEAKVKKQLTRTEYRAIVREVENLVLSAATLRESLKKLETLAGDA